MNITRERRDNIYIHPTAILYPNVRLGRDVYIGAYSVIGSPPEDKSKWLEEDAGVVIGDGVVINGSCTIDAGTLIPTTIENSVFIMKGVHIGHDAIIRQSATLSPHVLIGGHSIVGANTNMGMGSIVHQRCEVPHGCMIGMGSIITKSSKLEPNNVYVGSPVRYLRSNIR